MLYGWKQARVNEIQVAVATPVFQTRAEARAQIQRPLDDNVLILVRYGPVGDPYQQGDSVLWLRHARSTIVPDNRTILRALDTNRNLLTPEEQRVVALCRLHFGRAVNDVRVRIERKPAETEVARALPSLEVWLFGSALRSERPADLDILLIYEDRSAVVALHRMNRWEDLRPPFHLTIPVGEVVRPRRRLIPRPRSIDLQTSLKI
ncbi:hypothetical protein [Streptomyces canus]|uniref:hypothetical protein n=1 Tax=Streptomyces canus TaxID=58343 RepID=UPI000749B5DB|nr:hypothetical protein [Streptomyces canus]KUN12928.1 hypothetical protein AQI96_10595 [Streptomyces canus]